MSTYVNPIFDDDFPDPMILRTPDQYYYGYGSQKVIGGRIHNIPVIRSKDLVHWESLPDALPAKPPWASKTQKFWAPYVDSQDHTFFMYYSAEHDDGTGLCLGVATGRYPEGPFTDIGKPLRCGSSFINIDPMVFADPISGKRMLCWGSGFHPIMVQELSPDRTSFLPGTRPVQLLFPDVDSPYERLVEAAWAVRRHNYYYLFYSGDNCCGPDAHYAVMVARSSYATGPYQTRGRATGDLEGSVILKSNERWVAPGHASILTDDGGQDWIFYHAIDPNNRLLGQVIPGDRDVRRVLMMDRIMYRNGWPQIENGTPSTFERQGPVVRLSYSP